MSERKEKNITQSSPENITLDFSSAYEAEASRADMNKTDKLIIIDNFDTECDMTYDYFYEGEHIEEFVYSPTSCAKQISTRF